MMLLYRLEKFREITCVSDQHSAAPIHANRRYAFEPANLIAGFVSDFSTSISAFHYEAPKRRACTQRGKTLDV